MPTKASFMSLVFPSTPRRVFTLLLAGSAMALAGCAALAPATPEQAVTARSNAYWQARIKGDYASAYGYATPAYRKLHTAEQYRLQFGQGAALEGAEVVKVTCEPQKCVTRVKISAKPALAGLKVGTIATHLSETWLLEDGQWWLYQDL